MSEVIKVFAAYGPGQALSLALWPDGSFLFDLQGNAPPLFGAIEMGTWKGVDGIRGPGLYAEIASALPRTISNVSPRPDSAFLDVRHEVDGAIVDQRSVNLYAAPAHWNVVQARLLGLVQGPWIADRERTVTADVRWNVKSAALGQPVLDVTFIAAGREAASIPSPELAGGWGMSLLPAGATLEEQENFPSVVELHERVVRTTQPWTGRWLEMQPGKRYECRVEVNRQLQPGLWNVRVNWTAPNPGWGRPPPNHVAGRFVFDPGVLVVPTTR